MSTSNNVWSVIDERVTASISTRPPTASSISTLRIYFEKPNLIRTEDPLVWWNNHLEVLPFLSNLARKFLSVPGTSVPAERVFSKTGELISNRRSSIKPKHVDMMIFLNRKLKK